MTDYTCSECGFTREDIEAVIEHIVESHRGAGRVMEHEPEDTAESTWLDRVFRSG